MKKKGGGGKKERKGRISIRKWRWSLVEDDLMNVDDATR